MRSYDGAIDENRALMEEKVCFIRGGVLCGQKDDQTKGANMHTDYIPCSVRCKQARPSCRWYSLDLRPFITGERYPVGLIQMALTPVVLFFTHRETMNPTDETDLSQVETVCMMKK